MNLSQPNISSAAVSNSASDDFALVDTVFREYDIRGLADSELNPEFALRLGKALGQQILRKGENAVYIGCDGRLSSACLSESLCLGLRFSGCTCIDLGQTTTPILNFGIHHDQKASSGVMVTASHNPGIYNGFKIIIEKEVISGSGLQELKKMIGSGNFPEKLGGQYFKLDLLNHYLDYIVSGIQLTHPFKIVIDGGNATCGPVAVSLFRKLDCDVRPLFCGVDGHFPNHDPNPSDVNNLQTLIATVKSTGADLGLALDGDGDRLVVISSSGEVIWPDRLMMIFAQDILRQNAGSTVVFDVKSSTQVSEVIKEYSGIPVLCKTGHSHVRKTVQDTGSILGGEFSGHIFFNDRWYGFDDGLYAAARLLELLCAEEHAESISIDQIVANFKPSNCTPEILIPVPESEKFELMNKLTAQCRFVEADINFLDGLRAEFPGGWGLIRPSNTTPNLTLRFEANTNENLEQIKARFREQLKPFIHQIEDYI